MTFFRAPWLAFARWPYAKEVDYAKLQMQRFLAMAMATNAGGKGRPFVPGEQQYLQNALCQLMVASLVVLHVIPAATVKALEPQRLEIERAVKKAMQDSAKAALWRRAELDASPRRGAPRAPPTPSTPVRARHARDDDRDTPAMCADMGLAVTEASPEHPDASSQVSDAPNANGKRKSTPHGRRSVRSLLHKGA